MFLQLFNGGHDLPACILVEGFQKPVLDLPGQADLPSHPSSISYSY